MINCRFLIPGRKRDDYVSEGYQEYLKRLSSFGKFTIEFLPEEKGSSPEGALEKDGKNALNRIKEDGVVILVDVHGKEITSEDLASKFEEWTVSKSRFVFVLGSSNGLADSLRKRADYSICLSKMTFTHYSALLMLLEQVYRAIMINSGQTYAK